MMTSHALIRSIAYTLRSLALGSLIIGAPALAQNQTAPNAPPPTDTQPHQPTDPKAASSPHQRDVTQQGSTEAGPTQGTNPDAASSPHQRQVTGTGTLQASTLQEGMAVQDRSSRESIGSVSKVIKGEGDSQAYAVIATREGMAVPVPARVASAMTVDGKLLVDRSVLSGAPKVRQGDFKETDSHLKQKSDRYWAAHAS